MVEIFDVTEGSGAAAAGIMRGDFLISINGRNINDVLDYSFYLAEKHVTMKLHRNGQVFEATVQKKEYSDVGLIFETFLMDEKQSCRNKCVFCFIDQNPPGMRKTIYFKDDDTRLSFLHGNYVTLTNLSEEDIARIELMKTSPINISVHTTNPALRVRMLNNKNAGNVLDIIHRFAAAQITMNCQIVLCRSLNDGAELDKTMADLALFYPRVNSVSIVPAGLTKYRQGLYPLSPYLPEECHAIVRQVEQFAAKCRAKCGSRVFFCADEFYIKAGLPIKKEAFYEDFPQIENGVGMMSSMRGEFEAELRNLKKYDLTKKRNVSVATGTAAYEFILGMANALCRLCPNLTCTVYGIENNFYGHDVTVAGLLTGRDIREQLAGKKIGKRLFLPEAMIKRAPGEEDLFLDDTSPASLEWALDTEVRFISNNGADFIKKLLTE